MSKLTPGPWVVFNAGPTNAVLPAMREGSVADLIGNDADARLIAAAPFLIEVLREIRWIVDEQEDITDTGGPNDAMKIQMLIDAALARAGVTT